MSPPSKEPSLPNGWQFLPLNEVTSQKIVYGIVQAGPHDPNGVPYLKSSDIGGVIAADDLQRTSPTIHAKFGRSKVVPGDIVISLRGNTGATSIVPSELPEANLTQGTARITVSKNHCSEFVRQQIASASTQRLIQAAAKGSTFAEITLDDLRKIEILCPPEPEQRRIAGILSIWGRSIETVEALIANAREQKAALMQALLTGRRRLSGDGEGSAQLPAGWSASSLDEIFTFKNGLNGEKALYGAGVKFVNVMDVFRAKTLRHAEIAGSMTVTAKQLSEYGVRTGDVLFNRTSETDDEIALSTVYLDDMPAVFGGFVIRARPTGGALDLGFSIYAFQSAEIRRAMIRLGQGAIRANIGQSDLATVRLLLPPLAEQQRIAAILAAEDRAIEAWESQLAALREEKSALMQQLLTGKRRVKSVEIEAARCLL